MSNRVHEVDGIRGWAALIVVLFHMIPETFRQIYPVLDSFPFRLLSGHLAVTVFFVLSGEALSSQFIETGDLRKLAGLAVRRHSRLSIPVLASVMTVYILARLGMTYHGHAANIVHNEAWLGTASDYRSSFRHALMFPFVGMYQGPVLDSTTNPFTWTMGIELIGSIVIFAILPLIPFLRRPVIFLFLAALLCLFGQYTLYISDFLFGVMFAILRNNGKFAKKDVSGAFAATGPFVVAICMVVAAFSLRTPYQWIEAVLSPVLVYGIYKSPVLCRLFSSGLSQFLGQISFLLYLFQWPILISFTSYAIVRVGSENLTPVYAVSIALISTALCIVVARVLLPIETFTKWIGVRLTKFVMSDPKNRNGTQRNMCSFQRVLSNNR